MIELFCVLFECFSNFFIYDFISKVLLLIGKFLMVILMFFFVLVKWVIEFIIRRMVFFWLWKCLVIEVVSLVVCSCIRWFLFEVVVIIMFLCSLFFLRFLCKKFFILCLCLLIKLIILMFVLVLWVIILSKVDLLIFDLVKILIFWLILIVNILLIVLMFVLSVLVIFVWLKVWIGGVLSGIFCLNLVILVFLFKILLDVLSIFLRRYLFVGIVIFVFVMYI